MSEKKPWLPWVKQYQAARSDMKLYDPYTFLEVFLLFFPLIFLYLSNVLQIAGSLNLEVQFNSLWPLSFVSCL